MASVGVIGVQIPANQALSGEIDLGTFSLFAIEMPEAFNGSTLTFQSKAKPQVGSTQGQASEDWDNVYDDAGTEVSVTVGAGRIVTIDTASLKLAPLRYLRIRSGTSASPVNQNPTRELKLIVK